MYDNFTKFSSEIRSSCGALYRLSISIRYGALEVQENSVSSAKVFMENPEVLAQ